MKLIYRSLVAITLLSASVGAQQSKIAYPQTRKTAQTDDYFGRKVADPDW